MLVKGDHPIGLVRKQFFIDPEQNRELKRLAAAAGMSEGEFIRESLAARIAGLSGERDWRLGLEQLSGAWAERDDVQESMRELRRGWGRRLSRLGLSPKRAQ